MFPPFPHGVMAAHGSLEPFVLVRVQVGELVRIKAPAESVCRSFYLIRKRSSRKRIGIPGKIFAIQKICEAPSPYGAGTSQMHLYTPMSGEQEALAVVFRVGVKQFGHGAVFEHGADGAGQKRRNR